MLIQTIPDLQGFLKLLRITVLPKNGTAELDFEIASDFANTAKMARITTRSRQKNWWHVTKFMRVNADRTAREGATEIECFVRVASVGYDPGRFVPRILKLEFAGVQQHEAMNLMSGPPDERWYYIDMAPVEYTEADAELANKLAADPMGRGHNEPTGEEVVN